MYVFYILYIVTVIVVALFPFHLQCDEGTACLYDARFSPDGTWFTTVDSMGCLSYFGLGTGYHYKKVRKYISTE